MTGITRDTVVRDWIEANDPSVGGDHRGLARIRHYVGDFPEGEADGIFDITFSGEKFALVAADLA